MDNSRNEYEISEELFNLITRFQDEVHETAISYHKKLRNKSMTKSILDNVQGIGDVKKKELLNTFGSVEKIAEAKVEDLVKVKGITKDLAKVILDTLNKGE
jgi:excinuclease ABC subunit C